MIRALAPALLVLALAGCGAPVTKVSPPAARTAQVPVRVDGADYLVDIAPGLPGTALLGGQVVRVAGQTLRVIPQGGGFANSDGRRAKAVAEAGCTANRMTFNPTAQGRFTGAGAWEFPGACA
jgi:hypothetical protein